MAKVAAPLSSVHHLLYNRHHFLSSARNPFSLLTPRRTLPRLSFSLDFNITFAPSKPQQRLEDDSDVEDGSNLPGGQLFIPWIVRGEDGNLKLQAHPPKRLIHALADTKTRGSSKLKENKNKKKAVNQKDSSNASVAEVMRSKAARRFYNDNLREQPQRLNKVLAAAGVASRRSCEELIFGGKVSVNGSVCTTPQTRVDPARDSIYVNGCRLPKKLPPKLYLAINKPKGYICSSGEKEFKSVMCLLDDYLNGWDKQNRGLPRPRLFTVGRLDVATTGLIILTNDGDFSQYLAHPSSNLSKEYIATVDGAVKNRHLLAISEGTVIEGSLCVPDSVELLPRQPDVSRQRLRIVVHEGRNHEVRELVKNAGLQIYALKRVRIGGYRLPSDLGLGMHVDLSKANLKTLGWMV